MDVSVAIIGAAAGIVSAGFAIAGFWLMLGGRIQKAESDAANALQLGAEVENDLRTTDERVMTLTGAFSAYRETAIEKFVTHHFIGELEKRLVESQTKSEQRIAENQARSEQRLTDTLEGLKHTLDRLLEAGIRGRHQ